MSHVALRGRALCARSGPLSEALTSGERARGSFSPYVATLLDAALEGAGEKLSLDSAQWIALDYGDVIVHVFDEETRDYYDLEHLWNSAPAYRPERLR